MITWAVYNESGQPLPGLPVNSGLGVQLLAYELRTGGSRPLPTIVDLGGGQYGFEPLEGDRELGVAYLVRNVGAFPEYLAGAVCDAGAPFEAWVLLDAGGALWTGGPSSVSSWSGPAPVPAVIAPLPHLQTLTPTPAHLSAGPVSFLAVSPVGAFPEYVHAQLELPQFVTPAVPAIGFGEDLSDAVALLASGSYVVRRRAARALVDGRARDLDPATLSSIVASVQPASGREIDRLPEGLRDREVMALFTSASLEAAKPSLGLPGDVVEIDGFDFEVASHERWTALGNFSRYVVVRVLR